MLATKDTHPDLTPEQLQQANANKFSLDFVQLRIFELKTLSNIIKLAKILGKTNVDFLLFRRNLFYRIISIKVMTQLSWMPVTGSELSSEWAASMENSTVSPS